MGDARFFSLIAFGAAVATAAGAAQTNLKPSPPIVCDSNEERVIRGRIIETPGNGVEILGNCEVQIVDSRIVAGGVAVLLRNNGEVEISNSYLEGGAGGILAENAAEANYRNSTIRGGVRARNVAETHDQGGNDVSGTARSSPPASAGSGRTSGSGGVKVKSGDEVVEVTEGGVRVKDGKDTVEITSGGIRIDGRDAVTVDPGGAVRIDSGGASVVVDGDYVRLQSPNTSVEITGRWRQSGSSTYSNADNARILVDLHATDRNGELQVDLAGDVLFDFGRADIRPGAAAQLRKVAHLVRSRSSGDVFIIGHTDSIGSARDNQKLSEARAVAVMRWLADNEQIPAGLMKGRGIGSTKPVAHNAKPDGSDDPEGRAKNRRVEIRFASRP